MNKKYLSITAIVVVLAGAGFLWHRQLTDEYGRLSQWFSNSDDPSISMIRQDLDRISTPPPLRSTTDSPNAALTVHGVISETNEHRASEHFSALKESTGLRRAAELKLKDMFDRQYFAHESPTGEGPADLANKAGYAYVVIGENLALGNFANDKELVQGWMDSPGHRANIMNNGYTEIGVAVGKGMYEGKMTWLAVQEFGAPASACPEPDKNLEATIALKKSRITSLDAEIAQKKKEIDGYEPKQGEEYNRTVEEYNALVAQFNALINETKSLVMRYNGQVEAYNACLQKYSH